MNKAMTPKIRQVGLRQIAEAVGVSVCLVSQVLNGRLKAGRARPEVIRSIRKTARELNYRKNLQAVALQTGRQNVIAVFLHCLGAPGSGILAELTHGISDEAREHHQRLLLHHYLSAAEFRELAVAAHPGAVDGVIVGGVSRRELAADLQALRKQGLPVVTIHNAPLRPSLPNVGSNQEEVGYKATRHLIERGCRQIVHVCVRTAARNSSAERHRGYRRALQEAGLRFAKGLVVEASGYDYANGAMAIHTLLERGVAFDGLVGQSDSHAAAALNTLVSAGRRVPQEVKIIGVDDSPICTPAQVPLSSISQEFMERGRQAVRLLMQQVGGRSIRSMEVEPVVCARESTKGHGEQRTDLR
jgi:DNA-binding LacI/PurR family transcriptional regulator